MNLLVLASAVETATVNYFIRAFSQMGHQVVLCSDVPHDAAQFLVKGTVDVDEILKKMGVIPDALLFFEGGTHNLLPVNLNSIRCLTAWYAIDTHIDFEKHLQLSRLFDITFVAQKEFVSRLGREGIRQVHWLPLAFAPELLPSILPERNIDISHVGSTKIEANPTRHALLDRLRQEFQRTYFGAASPTEMGKIYSASRIVFNQSVNNDINMRFFEAMGSGAVLITNPIHNNGLEELFIEGTHYLTFQDQSSLVQTVKRMVADPKDCEEIGKAAKQLVMEKHTYAHRAKFILDIIAKSYKVPAARPEDYFSACLSLNLVSGALVFAALAFKRSDRGVYRKVMGASLACIVGTLALLVCAIESVRALRWK